MYFDSTCILNDVTQVRNEIGRSTETSTPRTPSPCYLSHESGSRDTGAQELVRYTHLLYVPYYPDVRDHMTVAVDGGTYEITGVWPAPRKHHLELGLMRLGDA